MIFLDTLQFNPHVNFFTMYLSLKICIVHINVLSRGIFFKSCGIKIVANISRCKEITL